MWACSPAARLLLHMRRWLLMQRLRDLSALTPEGALDAVGLAQLMALRKFGGCGQWGHGHAGIVCHAAPGSVCALP
jgi:hypothetical protein